ncbi:prenyltransferase/squalene oxidase repeat-containing protein [Micromonospora sp. NPDC126480]|uniref:prenyltransferase/squalene oxidase repeat-containing protein n=1 Tax=Micromonospora sp. NPDC126480 TaxID=3155312 RepID=UPI00332212BA
MTTTTVPDTGDGLAAQARHLLSTMERDRAGGVTPSVYETARLISDAPWLAGHRRRLDWLIAAQHGDGSWGAGDGYAVVPTVSAVEALLATLRRHEADDGLAPEVPAAAGRGLAALAAMVAAPPRLPDTPAADLIVPALADRVNEHLAWFAGRRAPAFWGAVGQLPAGERGRLDRLRSGLARGGPIPTKLLHAYEVLGPALRRRADVVPVAGAVGASPAATAAWLGTGEGVDPSVTAYLLEAVGRPAGPVPCCTPVAVFERAWVLANLTRVGLPVHPPEALVGELMAALSGAGAATGPGLPADADTTSVVLYALARLGRPVAPDSLAAFDLGSHFCTWQGEDGRSTTTNAHVLEALGWHAQHSPGGTRRQAARVAALGVWLRERQEPAGCWGDRWHASPYYATASVVAALDRYAPAEGDAVDRAVDWVLATQRADGSWGRWAGTREETAYALQVLLGVRRPLRPVVVEAAHRGLRHLGSADPDAIDPPLWHDKDLYAPVRIVRSAVLAARHLGSVRLGPDRAVSREPAVSVMISSA